MLALVLAPALISCAGKDSTFSDPLLVQGNNEFALDLYQRLAASEKGNLFFSPYGISSALAMTYAGAAGETAAEMGRVLRFREPNDRLHEAFGKLIRSVDAAGKSGQGTLITANSLWGQRGSGFEKDFLAVARRRYGAGLQEADFMANPETARQAVNAWVEEATRGKIAELIAPGGVNAQTSLVLAAAVYFKGVWASEFNKAETRDDAFKPGAGKEVRVPLMHQTAKFGYLETPEFQVLELPYKGGSLSMVVLLPADAAGLKALEGRLSEKELTGWLGRLKETKVEVYLPNFKTTSQFELGPALQSMGMKSAFGGGADFSGMDGRRDLHLSAAVHRAFVAVDEEGTEAAAASAAVMTTQAVESYPVFRADHPFLFLIRERTSGSVLFVGRLTNPRD